MRQKVLSYIDAHRDELFSMLSGMIKVDSQNALTSGGEKPMALYIQKKLEELGVQSDVYSPDDVEGILQHEDYLPGRGLENRPNIVAKIPGKKPEKSMMMCGHLDTVPIGDLSLWTVDPLGGEIKDGRIYGRGACDDKYALASWLFLVKMFRELGIQLNNDLYVGGYADEEFGGGDGALALCLKYPVDFLLNMDCKALSIWYSAMGGRRQVIVVRAEEVLDNCGRMIDAIAIVKEEIDKFGERRKAELHRNPVYAGTAIADSALRYMNVHTGTNTNDRNYAYVDFAFYTDRTGEEIDREFDDLLARISARMEEVGLKYYKMECLSRFFRYGEISPDMPQIQLLARNVAEQTGQEAVICGSCLSDLSIFIRNAKAAVSFGAGRSFSEYGGAHLPDEFIECDKLVAFMKTIACFVLDWDQTN